MGLTKTLAAGLVSVLWGIAPAAAFVQADFSEAAGSLRTTVVGATGAPGGDKADCRALQCGLLDQRSATRAVALAAGARPAETSYPPSMFPDLKSGASVEGAPSATFSTNDPSVRAAVEPALFAVLAPLATPSGGLCVDGGNLLGMTSTCNAPKPPDLGAGCVFDGRLLSLKASCSVAAPEPGTLFLLAIGLLGLAPMRRRELR